MMSQINGLVREKGFLAYILAKRMGCIFGSCMMPWGDLIPLFGLLGRHIVM